MATVSTSIKLGMKIIDSDPRMKSRGQGTVIALTADKRRAKVQWTKAGSKVTDVKTKFFHQDGSKTKGYLMSGSVSPAKKKVKSAKKETRSSVKEKRLARKAAKSVMKLVAAEAAAAKAETPKKPRKKRTMVCTADVNGKPCGSLEVKGPRYNYYCEEHAALSPAAKKAGLIAAAKAKAKEEVKALKAAAKAEKKGKTAVKNGNGHAEGISTNPSPDAPASGAAAVEAEIPTNLQPSPAEANGAMEEF